MERQVITVDIAPGNSQVERLGSSQGDIGRPMGVYVIQNGVALDCSAYSAELYILKPDGKFYTTQATVDATEKNLIKWVTALQETPVAGACAAQIRIAAGDEDIGTARFVEFVEAAPGDVGAASESEVALLTEYVRQARESATSAGRDATTASGAASSASGSASTASAAASAATQAASTATAAAERAEEVEESIPADYSQLSDDVSGLKSAFDDITSNTENIFDMSVFDGVEGITKDANGYYTGTGQAFQSAFGQSAGGIPGLSFSANKQYYLSVVAYTDGNVSTGEVNGLQFSFYTSDSTRIGRKSILNSVTTPEKAELFSTAGNSVGFLAIGVSNSALNIWHVKAIMLIASSIAVDYIPHLSANDIVARQKFADSVYREDLTGNKIANGFISTQNISVGSTLNLIPVSNTGMGYFITECKKDDCFVVTTTGLSSSTLPWVFIDGENKVLQYVPGVIVYTKYPIIAPSDGKLVINSAKAAEYELIKINNSNLIVQTGEAQFIRDAKNATRWLNKKIVVFGDSRTWYDKHSYTENTKSEWAGKVCAGYQEQMRKLMMAQVDSQGASGETSAEICTRIRAFDFTGYDAVFLEGGVNDFVKSSQVTVGELAPIGSTFDTTTIYGAWQSAIEYILVNYPSVLIYMDIPPIAWIHQADDVFPYDVAKIKGEVAALYNIPCLDLYKTAGINIINRDYWYCDDVDQTNWRLHFNDYGNVLIGQKVAGFLATH